MSKLRDHLLTIVQEKAKKYNLDYKLLDAIIQTESNYDFYSVRFEANSKYKLDIEKFAKLNNTTAISEEMLQKLSWGLFQIMGSTARSLSFQGPLPSLCDVDNNLELGCKFILQLQKRYSDVKDVISAYNAGTAKKDSGGEYFNQGYVNRVLEKMNT